MTEQEMGVDFSAIELEAFEKSKEFEGRIEALSHQPIENSDDVETYVNGLRVLISDMQAFHNQTIEKGMHFARSRNLGADIQSRGTAA